MFCFVFFLLALSILCVLANGRSVRQHNLNGSTALYNRDSWKELTEAVVCKRSEFEFGAKKQQLPAVAFPLILLRNTKSLREFHSAIFCIRIPHKK